MKTVKQLKCKMLVSRKEKGKTIESLEDRYLSLLDLCGKETEFISSKKKQAIVYTDKELERAKQHFESQGFEVEVEIRTETLNRNI